MSYIYEVKNSTDLYRDIKCLGRNNFSYEGAKALMECLAETAEENNLPIEYDPILFCSEYEEWDDNEIPELLENYDYIEDLDALRQETIVIEFIGGIIIQNF